MLGAHDATYMLIVAQLPQLDSRSSAHHLVAAIKPVANQPIPSRSLHFRQQTQLRPARMMSVSYLWPIIATYTNAIDSVHSRFFSLGDDNENTPFPPAALGCLPSQNFSFFFFFRFL